VPKSWKVVISETGLNPIPSFRNPVYQELSLLAGGKCLLLEFRAKRIACPSLTRADIIVHCDTTF
jgi:hypothetical protein